MADTHPRRHKITLNRRAKVISVLGIAILLFIISLPLWQSLTMAWLTAAALISFVWAATRTPRYITMTDSGITIHKNLGRIEVPYTEITTIELLPNPDLSWMLLSTDGFMGYGGSYRSRVLGKYDVCLGNPADAILIMRRHNLPLLISCDKPQLLIHQAEEHIKATQR